jgi:hypothetical protein
MSRTAKQLQQHKWFVANRAHSYAKAAQWAKDNREKATAMTLRWQRNNPEAAAAIRKRYKANNPDFSSYDIMRQRAKKRGVPCTLTRKQVMQMVASTAVCPVLGIPLQRGSGKAADNSPSLDCFYPELGYVPGNVFVISYRANMLKSNATIEEVHALLVWMEATTVVIDETKE